MCETDKNTLENGVKRKNHRMADDLNKAMHLKPLVKTCNNITGYGCGGEILSGKSEQ